MRVFVTGGTGFIGSHLVDWLVRAGHSVACVVRRGAELPAVLRTASVSVAEIDDLAGEADWGSGLAGVDAVVHLAARVHVMRETAADPLEIYRRVNVRGSRRLAEAAVAAGVKRFVYVSSVKVNGERTDRRPFRADDPPDPRDPYAVSKLEAEQVLWQLGVASGTEFVVIRPPLVYGPGVKGNLRSLVRWSMRGLPLPLGAVNNRRDMVSIDNLVDFIGVCLVHPRAAGQVFLVADGVHWSTPQLIAAIAAELHRPSRLFSVPLVLLRSAAALLGRRALVDRLCDSLQLDIHKNRELLQWSPVQSPAEALRQTVSAIVNEGSNG